MIILNQQFYFRFITPVNVQNSRQIYISTQQFELGGLIILTSFRPSSGNRVFNLVLRVASCFSNKSKPLTNWLHSTTEP